MDAKEQNLVADLHQLITNHSFYERDILALLILLREHATDGSAVRELGDFVAHREKDRGALKKYVQHMNAFVEAAVKNGPAQMKVKPVYSSAEFRDSLNTSFARFGLPQVSPDLTDDVLICIMSLLQDVRIVHRREEIGHLLLSRFASELWLFAVVMEPIKKVPVLFPALTVPNRHCPVWDAQPLAAFSGLVEARFTEGRLRLSVNGDPIDTKGPKLDNM
ncbi:MAG: hypothetical protein AB7F94_18630 [Nitrospira sp.]